MRARRTYGYVNWYHFIEELHKQFDWQFTQLQCVDETKELGVSGSTVYQVDTETKDIIHNVYLGTNDVLVLSIFWKLNGIVDQYYEKDDMKAELETALQDFIDNYNKASDTNIIMKYTGDYDHRFVCCPDSFKIDNVDVMVRGGEITVEDIEDFKRNFNFVKKWYEYDCSRKRPREGWKLLKEQSMKMWKYGSYKKGNGLLVKLPSKVYIYAAPTDLFLQ